MSCIAGIINLDGAPVDREILERMVAALKSRAPDESGMWIDGNVGFGHAMLRISPESKNEQQPCSINGEIWITADARVDGRNEFIGKLRSSGRQVNNDAPDVELILHAYQVFGDSFTEHLIGDFAFALWDGRKKKLICARDHFGVRPFHYVKTPQALLFASDIDALLEHPAVSRNLDETAIGDFLLFGSYMDPEISIYQDIRCLAPASLMCLNGKHIQFNKYWDPSRARTLKYRRISDYVEHFTELHKQAVADRIRADNVALELSGGLDSSSIAAAAVESASPNTKLTAYSYTAKTIFPKSPEPMYAAQVASFLPISMVETETVGGDVFDGMDDHTLATAEPANNPFLSNTYRNYKSICESGARVLLSGHGGDAVLDSSDLHFGYLWNKRRLFQLFAEVSRHVWITRSLHGTGLRSALLGTRPTRPDWIPPYPDWLRHEFTSRTHLKDRYESAWYAMYSGSGAEHQLSQPWLSFVFSGFEPFRLPLVARHPFYDLRVVEFLQALPGFTKFGKNVLRESMQGRLPEPVRLRPKAPATGDAIRVGISEGRTKLSAGREMPFSNCYVDQTKFWRAYAQFSAGKGPQTNWSTVAIVAPLMLEFWRERAV